MFSMYLVTLDSYQSAPLSELDVTFSDFRGNEIRQVPVIRIFGSTINGIKTCLHIHGVFPYLYIPCTVHDNNVNSYMYKLASAIDNAINISLGSAMSNTQQVYKIQRVCGIPLYGYHKKEHLFFKIYFYNPAMIKRAADLFQNGVILGQTLQPHEAHIPFILQFMVDYNLYGMSLINLSEVKIRRNIGTAAKKESQSENSLSFESQTYLPEFITRQSTCKLEVDTQACEILNRQEIQSGIDLNPGIAAIWNEESHRREAKGLKIFESQLLYTNDDGREYGPTESDVYQEKRLLERLQNIPQFDEELSPATSKTLSYPLEVQDKENSFNASDVLNHFQLSKKWQQKNKNEMALNNELLGLENSIQKENSLHDETIECSILDSQDMHLVEILAHLAEEKEEEEIDNDSVLASQFSLFDDIVQDRNDDDEIEDLNITSLDLDSLSSWSSVTGSQFIPTEKENKRGEDNEKRDDQIEHYTGNESLMDFAQYDGPSDLALTNKHKRLDCKQYRDIKSKRRKTPHIERTIQRCKNINMYKFDHQDLDIYDVDELQLEKLKYGMESEWRSNQIDCKKFSITTNQALSTLCIPALDGNTVDSSSDSEVERDITINREEKRICVYKSCTNLKNEDNIVNISQKKRGLESEADNVQSPHKRRNITVNCDKKEEHTPVKQRSLCSPRSLTKKYSPLNITIISPKSDKNNEIYKPCSSKSSCFSQHLRVNLFREKLSSFASEINESDPLQSTIRNEVCFTEYESSVSKNEELINFYEGDHNVIQKNVQTQSFRKNTKETRKKLNFINNVEDIDSKKNHIDQCNFDNISLKEKVTETSLQENGTFSTNILDSFQLEKSKQIFTKTKSGLNYKYNLPSTSADNGNLNIISGEDGQDGEDICNITFTQYLHSKLESDCNTQISISVEGMRDAALHKSIIITTKFKPPSRERIINSMKTYSISGSKCDAPFFSNKKDVMKQREDTNKGNNNDFVAFKTTLDSVTGIKLWRRLKINEFYPSGSNIKTCDMKRVLAGYNSTVICPLIQPPMPKNVETWLQAKKYLLKKKGKSRETGGTSNIVRNIGENKMLNEASTDKQNKEQSQSSNTSLHSVGSNYSINISLRQMLENPLLYKNNNTQQHLGHSFGQIEFTFKRNTDDIENENFQNAKGLTVYQYLTMLSIEVHVSTRDKLLPNPEHDPIEGIFYAIHTDVPLSSTSEYIEHGAILVSSTSKNLKIGNIQSSSTLCSTSYVSSEEDLLNSLIVLVRHCDPDILVGWETESLSWGYIFHRASHIGINNFAWQISRISNITPSKAQISDNENSTDAKVPGRIILDVWRIMRHELALLNYTFENVMYHVMRERISSPTFHTLTTWWKDKNITTQWRVIAHYAIRVVGTLRMLRHLDLIGRTCEHARLIGIQFYEVFSRGSQFRVESMMLRLAKPLNYIPVSPSMQQRARMRAPQSLPLIMEPQSTFYTDPLIVLDFQSLYPSIIIAYNYCFSTCLGRVEHIGQYEPYEFGASTLKINKNAVKKLLGKINFAPCGVAFVKPEVRIGILPRMLTEILNTRLLVKQSMKIHGNENHVLQRVLHSQQLGLKLIANVTYGYTAANYSGRMPCIEVGDSVVSKGRETLERAIKIVESTPRWGAQVVYGDTDSLFILLPGKTRKDAFTIGAEIADTVTAANPPPVKLKFEKVIQPSILQTKKRYCGYMYETPEQQEPEYFAKGIETVRRDGCPAVAKILEKTLKILFDTKDLSLIKMYVTRQFDKILRRTISIQDLTFAKEFRGLHGYKPTACVPALELTRRLIRKDPRAIPRTGERVRYVIVAGPPNQALIHCVRTPMEVIMDEGLYPNSIYYITKVIIPPLNRCLNLIGVDANMWYRDMNHRQCSDNVINLCIDNQKSTIRQFFSAVICAACGEHAQKDICANCLVKSSQTITILYEKLRCLERTHHELTMICQSCTGYLEEPKCESLDCPVLYRLIQSRRDLIQIPYLNDIIQKVDKFYFAKTF